MPREELKTEFDKHRDRILVVAGTGIACATHSDNKCASWKGLLEHGRDHCRDHGYERSPNWYSLVSTLINAGTADWLIYAATEIEATLLAACLGRYGELGRWLGKSIGSLELDDPCVINTILSWKVPIATTNYDNLFEDASHLPTVLWSQNALALKVLASDARGILHLHGHYLTPDGVVFGAKSYETVCRDSRFQNVLHAAFTMKTIIFIGCGAGNSDPNLGGLLEWSRDTLATAERRHYHLVLNTELEQVRKLYREKGCIVIPIGYGDDYAALGPFLSGLAAPVQTTRVSNEAPEVEAHHKWLKGEVESKRVDAYVKLS
jgi:hypothetical protein